MRSVAVFWAIFGAASLLALGAPAAADGAGRGYIAAGPAFALPDVVRVARQDVHIALYAVHLTYVFETDAAQVVQFSFAMPEMPVDASPDIAMLDENADTAGLAADTQPANYLRLAVSVNDEPLTLAGHGRALLDGRDVTRQLLDAGVPLLASPEDPDAEPLWRHLPPETQAAFEASGLISNDTALWTYQADFMWNAVLDPGETRLDVTYVPVFNYWSDIDRDDFPAIAAGGPAARAYCIDDTLRRAFLDGPVSYDLYTVTHRNTLPGGWRGPVGQYRLVIDKEDPADLVAFCPPDAPKTSPTRFEWTATAYTPGSETGVLFFANPD